MMDYDKQKDKNFFATLAISLGISSIVVTITGITASSIDYAIDRLTQTAQNK